MTHQVTALNYVNGNATGVDGILQNVAFILSTFALPCYSMRKINTKRLIECIQRFEPRAIVVEVAYLGDMYRGKLEPTVKVIVNES
ncbi:hypothetical protein MHB42_09005 [Lysinibacillus sp. FSL K6-0232]|uniref:hypothetical protein n=1 Tax=unclassified Lysinibacillus TaxID=2636778 RepID=UPI0030F7958A